MTLLSSILLAAASIAAPVLPGNQSPWWAGTGYWTRRHEAKLKEIAEGPKEYDFVFVGDSITHNWEGWSDPIDIAAVEKVYAEGRLKFPNGPGRRVWNEMKREFRLLNLGCGGDTTANVLWRLDHGEMDGYTTKGVALMIGTNNGEEAREVAEGIAAVVRKIQEKQPQAVVVLMPIFPCRELPTAPRRVRNDEVASRIQSLADGARVVWLDFGNDFLEPDGRLSAETMPDFLHPLEPGYRLWRSAIEPVMRRIVGRASRPKTLFFAGDSTLDDHERKDGVLYASWGTTLEKFMKPGNRVMNFAQSGASTKSFLEDGHWDRLIRNVREGDFVAIQFGHNDQKRSTDFYRTKRWADPNGLYREIVRGWVAEVRAKGATPILMSPIVRGTFAKDGQRLVDRPFEKGGVTLASYRDAMQDLSIELGCDFVDMNRLTHDELERVGQERANRYFFISTGIRKGKDGEPSKDVTHPVKLGAERFAQLFLEDVRKRNLAVAGLFEAGELRLCPTFASCGVVWSRGTGRDARLSCRKRGEDGWREAPAFPSFKRQGEFRGSLLGLDENTDYEVRVSAGDETLAYGTFRTWSSDVPVARTVEIDPARATFPLRISDRGLADGWIRYTVAPGVVLTNSAPGTAMVEVKDASHVLFDDIALVGGPVRYALSVEDSEAVRIRNCDISGWGRTGKVRYDRLGRAEDVASPGEDINYDGAIHIGRGCRETVVERCWIHDPRGRANSWRYAHPAGPEAVMVARPAHSTVIRWCDFTGSDEHRWNDAVEGEGNFEEDGGFNRDADIYGNFMNLCNDDCIELDGGQRNVRCFGNRFEGALCGVSVQGCMASPSYVCDNLFSGMGDRFGECGQTIKTSGFDPDKTSPFCLVHDNILWGGGTGFYLASVSEKARYDVRNNVFCGGQRLEGKVKAAPAGNLREEDNAHGVEIGERDLPVEFPRRPLGFTLDRARLTDSFETAATSFVVRAVSHSREPVSFRIAKNEAFDWFDVSPALGTIPAHGEVSFVVAPENGRMGERRFWRGSFLVRTPDGLSRPFSFELENRAFVEPFRCEKPGEIAVYAEMEPFILDGEREFAFDWPKDARGWFLLRLAGPMNAPYEVSVDGSPWAASHVQGFPGLANWSIVSPATRLWKSRIASFNLKAGRHALKVRAVDGSPGTIRIEGAVLTDSPGSFEPR